MTRPLVTYPDAERLVVDLLAADLAEETCTIGIGVPTDWTADDDPHLQVALDGTPADEHPIRQVATIRVTAWARNPSDAKTLAQLAHGHLLTHFEISRLTGLLRARDEDHQAELASFTVRASVRSTPIT